MFLIFCTSLQLIKTKRITREVIFYSIVADLYSFKLFKVCGEEKTDTITIKTKEWKGDFIIKFDDNEPGILNTNDLFFVVGSNTQFLFPKEICKRTLTFSENCKADIPLDSIEEYELSVSYLNENSEPRLVIELKKNNSKKGIYRLKDKKVIKYIRNIIKSAKSSSEPSFFKPNVNALYKTSFPTRLYTNTYKAKEIIKKAFLIFSLIYSTYLFSMFWFDKFVGL